MARQALLGGAAEARAGIGVDRRARVQQQAPPRVRYRGLALRCRDCGPWIALVDGVQVGSAEIERCGKAAPIRQGAPADVAAGLEDQAVQAVLLQQRGSREAGSPSADDRDLDVERGHSILPLVLAPHLGAGAGLADDAAAEKSRRPQKMLADVWNRAYKPPPPLRF